VRNGERGKGKGKKMGKGKRNKDGETGRNLPLDDS
jgi:hypothetical protein